MVKSIKMTPEIAQAMSEQLASFTKKFGREPGPNDPVFFDPDKDVPTPLTAEKLRTELLKAMEAANIPEERRHVLLRQFGID